MQLEEKKFLLYSRTTIFSLLLSFDNGEKRIFDMKPYLKKNTVFEQFLNFDDFKRVYLDSDHCVCWDKNPKIDSETD